MKNKKQGIYKQRWFIVTALLVFMIVFGAAQGGGYNSSSTEEENPAGENPIEENEQDHEDSTAAKPENSTEDSEDEDEPDVNEPDKTTTDEMDEDGDSPSIEDAEDEADGEENNSSTEENETKEERSVEPTEPTPPPAKEEPSPKPATKPEPAPTLPDPSTLTIESVNKDLIYKTSAPVNFRVGPNADYTLIRPLSAGTALTPIGKHNTWYKVSINGVEGFIHQSFVSVTNPNPAPKPADPAPEPKPEPKPEPIVEVDPTYIRGILLVNKGHGLPSTYAPGENGEARAQFEKMKAAAAEEDHIINAFSVYRSYQTQKTIYNNNVARHGKAAADRFSARPGFSEHQTGLAFDIGWDGMRTTQAMGSTETGVWMAENSWRYGFILRYPEGKTHITGYIYEPWHYRYVGLSHGEAIYQSGQT